MKGIIPRVTEFCKQHASGILTLLGAGGVIATTAMAIRATPKADRLIKKAKWDAEEFGVKDYIVVAGPIYIPTILMGTATITCIFGSHVVSNREQAALMSAYTMLNESFKMYKSKLIELYGEEADRKIRDEIVLQNCAYHQLDMDEPDEKVLWFDPLSGNTICRYEKEIIDAEYHFNRNFILMGEQSLNDFYEFLGMPTVDSGDVVGWSLDNDNGYLWIDFEHHLVNRDDGGTPIYEIDILFSPEPL